MDINFVYLLKKMVFLQRFWVYCRIEPAAIQYPENLTSKSQSAISEFKFLRKPKLFWEF